MTFRITKEITKEFYQTSSVNVRKTITIGFMEAGVARTKKMHVLQSLLPTQT